MALKKKELWGGTFTLAQKMAQAIGSEKIILNQFITKVIHDKNKVILYTNNGESYQTKKVIFTIAAPLLKKINFSPQLPKNYQIWWNGYIPGQAFKVHFVYDKPFWRNQNNSGWCLKTDDFITEIVDNSLPNSPYGILTAFVYGHQKKLLQQKFTNIQARAKVLSDEIAQVFGTEARNYQHYEEYDWGTDKLHVGCYTSQMKLKMWINDAHQVNNKHYKNLYWSGTEESLKWTGYFEGAVNIGYEIVEKVLKEMIN